MIFFADGAGWNGTLSGYLVADDAGRIFEEWFQEEKTNNEMEYAGVLRALKEGVEGDEIKTDSQLVCFHLSGAWRCKDRKLYPLMVQAVNLVSNKKIRVTWVGRKFNRAGVLIDDSRASKMASLIQSSHKKGVVVLSPQMELAL